jgi:hypothetical protein
MTPYIRVSNFLFLIDQMVRTSWKYTDEIIISGRNVNVAIAACNYRCLAKIVACRGTWRGT